MKEKLQDKEITSTTKQTAYYRQAIDLLKTETSKLRDQMSVESTIPLPIGTESYIARLQDQEDTYTKKIKTEKIRGKDLDKKIAEVQKKIAEKRVSLAMPKDKKIKESNETILLKIKKTQHKQDKTLQKYNEVLARNKHLRDDIDYLRKEKKTSEEILKNLEQECENFTLEQIRIKEKSEKLKIEGLQYKKELEALEKKRRETEQDMEKFNRDWQELDKIIDKDIESAEVPVDQDNPELSLTQIKDIQIIEEPSLELNPLENSTARDALKRIETFSEAFKKIEEETGVSDAQGLVKIFVEAEQHNYSLFSHVNELTDDIKRLESQILEMKLEIEKYTNLGAKTAVQRETIIKDLGEKLKSIDTRSDIYEKKYDKAKKTIDAFIIGVNKILKKIQATDDLIEEVNESNLMHYLGIIELRTNEILQIFKFCKNSENETPVESPHLNNDDKKIFKVVPPVILDKEGEEDENSIILQKIEFRDRAQIKMQDPKKPMI